MEHSHRIMIEKSAVALFISVIEGLQSDGLEQDKNGSNSVSTELRNLPRPDDENTRVSSWSVDSREIHACPIHPPAG